MTRALAVLLACLVLAGCGASEPRKAPPSPPPAKPTVSSAAYKLIASDPGDGVYIKVGPQEMIATNTSGGDYLVQSRIKPTDPWSGGTPYDDAEQAVKIIVSGSAGKPSQLRVWRDDKVRGPAA